MVRSCADLTELRGCDAPRDPVFDTAKPTSEPLIRAATDNQDLGRSIFQQSWWLDCATAGRWEEVTVKSGDRTVGWLPYLVSRRWGFAISNMPLLTHTLGPIVDAGNGRPNTRLLNRFTITSELLQQLPKLAHFRQVLAAGTPEALPYQAFGCHVRCQFTFISDCSDMEAAWKSMRDKTRNLIRRSQERSLVTEPGDPEEFLRFYAANCESRRQINRYHTPIAKKLLELCLRRDQGRIFLLRARGNERVQAGIFVVWDADSMYFLMSSRAADSADSGAISHLVWLGMNEAHRRGVKFDFDGVSSPGTFRFLSGFGGEVATRFAVEKFSWPYHSLDKLRALAYGNAQQPFN
jgi:lipid II:glycine glycyltransferase (peptidoglycan interpeptide bridge formation enzyme)